VLEMGSWDLFDLVQRFDLVVDRGDEKGGEKIGGWSDGRDKEGGRFQIEDKFRACIDQTRLQ
jgi:hypothetical protein